ncbi:hypothetical protein VZT92_026739 [Zoarces viviparus]|uniref:Uncharacterized protein n=1 Tax=Zoarces viviparus TaxID=48416 RepID=A0AAW1DTL8_ZOAVI
MFRPLGGSQLSLRSPDPRLLVSTLPAPHPTPLTQATGTPTLNNPHQSHNPQGSSDAPHEGQRRLRSIRTKTSRHRNSFFPSAVGLINRARDPH